MRKFALPLAFVAFCLPLAAPVAAQGWRLQPRVQREIQSDINELDRHISRAADRRVISRRDARDLRREASDLRRTLGRFSRDGLDRREVEILERQVNRLRSRLRLESRHWSRRR